ncbi:MAG TPA: phytanoyl-CoA dioxygenase family protein [Anaerolineae bacterium]
MPGLFTDAQVEQYQGDGYLIVPQLFDAQEMDILRTTAKNDQAMEQNVMKLADGEGGVQSLTLWNKAGDDLYGLVARTHRVVDRMEQLLGGEVYHYHSKMSIKEPYTGGAWAWHQDYGYWYANSVLRPLLASCFIAVDPNTRANGCMQVLKGSQEMGRVEHGRFGDQTGADPERVEEARKIMELVYVELAPGDALFFHCNLLHHSDQNHSPDPRWSLICCYNAARNNPYKESHHPRYSFLEKVDDAAIKTAGAKLFPEGTKFLRVEEDATIGADKPVARAEQ